MALDDQRLARGERKNLARLSRHRLAQEEREAELGQTARFRHDSWLGILSAAMGIAAAACLLLSPGAKADAYGKCSPNSSTPLHGDIVDVINASEYLIWLPDDDQTICAITLGLIEPSLPIDDVTKGFIMQHSPFGVYCKALNYPNDNVFWLCYLREDMTNNIADLLIAEGYAKLKFDNVLTFLSSDQDLNNRAAQTFSAYVARQRELYIVKFKTKGTTINSQRELISYIFPDDYEQNWSDSEIKKLNTLAVAGASSVVAFSLPFAGRRTRSAWRKRRRLFQLKRHIDEIDKLVIFKNLNDNRILETIRRRK